MTISDELFHEELLAMHLHEQDHHAAQRRQFGDYPKWYALTSDERGQYRRKVRQMIQEAREPRG